MTKRHSEVNFGYHILEFQTIVFWKEYLFFLKLTVYVKAHTTIKCMKTVMGSSVRVPVLFHGTHGETLDYE